MVDKDGWAKEIEAKVYGQKRRNLNDGIFIDRNNTWFGFRSIPFSKHTRDLLNEKNKKLLESWADLSEKFLFLDYSELNKLSQWFQNLPERDKCEMAEILLEDCAKFKSIIGYSSWSSIGSNLKINFEKLNEIAHKEWKDKLPKFSDIIGRKGIIYIGKLSGYENKFGKILDIWLEEEIKKELNKAPDKEKSKKNGVNLARKILTNNLFGEGCEKYKESSGDKLVYGECFTKSPMNFDIISNISGEKYFFPRVIDVVKAGKWWDKPVYAPSSFIPVNDSEQKRERDPNQWKYFPEGINWHAQEGFKNNAGYKGVINIGCDHVQATDKGWSLAQLFTSTPLERHGCWEFYNIFFGDAKSQDISDKRWCLFEIPEAKSFVKETNILGPFYFSNWNKGNRFWTRCDLYGI